MCVSESENHSKSEAVHFNFFAEDAKLKRTVFVITVVCAVLLLLYSYHDSIPNEAEDQELDKEEFLGHANLER